MSSGRAQGSAPYLNAAVAGTVILVKTEKVALASYSIYNGSNATAFLRLYDAAAAADVTNGTTVPVYVIGGPTVSNFHAGYSRPLQFTKGLCIVACTTAADTGTTAPNVALVVSLGLTT